MKLPAALDREFNPNDPVQIALGDLMLLCATNLQFFGTVLTSGKHGKFEIARMQDLARHVHQSVGTLSKDDQALVFRSFVQFAFTLAADVWGEDTSNVFRSKGSSDEQKRAALRSWIEMLVPTVESINENDGNNLKPETVIESLLALEAGETTGLLKGSANRSRSKIPHTYNKIKLEISLIRLALADIGMKPRAMDAIVHRPINVSWDVMRKWRKDATDVLHRNMVEQVLRRHKEMLEAGSPEKVEQRLRDRMAELARQFDLARRNKAD